MGSWLRKLRGAIGLSLTWGVGWSAVAAVLLAIIGLIDPGSIDPGDVTGMLQVFFALGVISGAVFSMALSLLEHRKSIAELSTGHMAAWGAIGAALLPLFSPVADSQGLIMAPIGALFASGSVILAKRAALPELTEQDRLDAASVSSLNG